jgi:outer membrane protein OmpA-like peptidoglycan-associated protein
MTSLSGLWLTLALLAAPPQYTPAMDQSQWQISGDQFQCQMQQNLGAMGTLAFSKEPAQAIEMQLTLHAAHLELQDVQGQVVSAGWQPEQMAPAVQFSPTFINAKVARFIEQVPLVMQQLQQGYWLQLMLDMPGQEVTLTVPNLKSSQALAEFQSCIDGLLPLSWAQAREFQLFYPINKRQPSADDAAYLKTLALYIQQDKAVKKVLIDGYTDDMGSSIANRVMSEERADEVASHLIESGVSKSKLEIRAHGNRYPAAAGDKAQSHNRRVLIRLIRTQS